MSRLRWPDSTNSVSEKPGTIHNVRPHSSLGQQAPAHFGSGGNVTSTRYRLRNLQP